MHCEYIPNYEMNCFIALLTKISKDVENKYKVHTFKIGDKYKALIPLEVRFTHNDTDKDRTLPSPVLLDCHFRLAKILNASGMAAAFDSDYDEWEEIKGRVGAQLPEDGDIDIGQALCVGLQLDGYAFG
jgi:hypothetical protein